MAEKIFCTGHYQTNVLQVIIFNDRVKTVVNTRFQGAST